MYRGTLSGEERIRLAASAMRFQRIDGTGVAANTSCPYAVPAGTVLPPVCVVQAMLPTSSGFTYYPSATMVSGTYGVSQTSTNTQYLDPANALPFVQNLSVTLSGTTLGATGSTVSAVKLADVFIYSDPNTVHRTARLDSGAALNISAPITTPGPITAGEYQSVVYTCTTPAPNHQDVLPDTFYFTDTNGPDITVP